jgi:hypothetical protein
MLNGEFGGDHDLHRRDHRLRLKPATRSPINAGAGFTIDVETPWRFQLASSSTRRTGKAIPTSSARLKVLFSGINLHRRRAHHFARPGIGSGWALHASGFTPRVLSPFEERELPS